MLNREDISKLTKFELTKAIAELVYPNKAKAINANNAIKFNVDYCNNWNDLMTLVVEHEISLTYLKDGRACAYQYIRGGDEDRPSTQAQHKNLQRALAETLLLVLQEKTNG